MHQNPSSRRRLWLHACLCDKEDHDNLKLSECMFSLTSWASSNVYVQTAGTGGDLSLILFPPHDPNLLVPCQCENYKSHRSWSESTSVQTAMWPVSEFNSTFTAMVKMMHGREGEGPTSAGTFAWPCALTYQLNHKCSHLWPPCVLPTSSSVPS